MVETMDSVTAGTSVGNVRCVSEMYTEALRAYVNRKDGNMTFDSIVDSFKGITFYEGLIEGMEGLYDDNDADLDHLIPPDIRKLRNQFGNIRARLMFAMARALFDPERRNGEDNRNPLLFSAIDAMHKGDVTTLAAMGLSLVGMGQTIARMPQHLQMHIIEALTRHEENVCVLDLAGVLPAETMRLGSPGIERYHCATRSLVIKNALWCSCHVLNRKDNRWALVCEGFSRIMAAHARLTSLTLIDCNLDLYRTHVLGMNHCNVDLLRHPLQDLTSLAFKFTDPASHRYASWTQVHKLLQWMCPMPSLRSLTLPDPGNVTLSASGGMKKLIRCSFPHLTHIGLKLPCKRTWRTRQDARYPGDVEPRRNEAVDYGRWIQLGTALKSISLHTCDADILTGWGRLSHLTHVSLGIVPKEMRLHSNSMRWMRSLISLDINLTTEGTNRRKETCDWCAAAEFYYRSVSTLTRLQILKTQVKCASECCKWDLQELGNKVASNLIELDIEASAKSDFCTYAEGPLALTIPALPACTRLSLAAPVAPGQEFGESFRHLHELRELKLRLVLSTDTDVTLGNASMRAITEGLKYAECVQYGRLHTVNLRDIRQVGLNEDGLALPHAGSNLLQQLQRSGLTTLQSLTVPHCKPDQSLSVLRLARACPHLTSLHNILLSDTVALRRAGFALPSGLKRLSLQVGTIPKVGPEVLTRLQALQYLQIHFIRQYNPAVLVPMVSALGALRQLRELIWVGGNYIDRDFEVTRTNPEFLDGWVTAFTCLARYSRLTTLELYRCPIIQGHRAFAIALCDLQSLRQLKINGGVSSDFLDTWALEIVDNPMRVVSFFLGEILDITVAGSRMWSLFQGMPELYEFDFTIQETMYRDDASRFVTHVARGPTSRPRHTKRMKVKRVNPHDIYRWILRRLKSELAERGVHAFKIGGHKGIDVAQYVVRSRIPSESDSVCGLHALNEAIQRYSSFTLDDFIRDWDISFVDLSIEDDSEDE